MTSQFKKLLQIGIIVENAEKQPNAMKRIMAWAMELGRVSTDNMPD